MAVQVRALLYYLNRYVKGDRARFKRLVKQCKQAGMKSGPPWRNLNLRTEPPASVFLVYLTFLHREKAIRTPRAGERGIFIYAFPELLRAKKAAA